MADPTVPMIEENAEDFVFLADRSEAEWSTLIAAMERSSFAAGEVVVAAGAKDRTLCLLVSGQLEVLAGPEDGTFKKVDAPTVVGEIAFLDGRPRSVSLRAVTDGELLKLGYEQFEALAEREPELTRVMLFDLGRIVAARLRLATDFIVQQLDG